MIDSLGQFNQYLDTAFSHGPLWVYMLLFVACFIENLFPPFPGDSFIIAGGGLVAAGRLALLPTALAIILGGLSSVMILFLVGRNYGHAYFVRKNFKYFTADDVNRMHVRLQKWGALILLVSRFVLGLRSIIAIAAGVAEYPIAKMAIFSAISYALFVSSWMFFGAEVVKNLDAIEYYISTYNLIFWSIVAVLALGWLTKRYLDLRKKRNSRS
ncbi:MAG: DedA family protein [Candidatus Zixiibacteriota bacterium]